MNHDTVPTALVAAGSLEDAPLVDADGEDLGTLEALLIHADGRSIAYAVVTYGNLFDQGFRHVAVPWSALTIDIDEHRVVLGVHTDRLADAPAFVKGGWPKRVDDAWMSDLHRHYGLRYERLRNEPERAGRQAGGPA